MHTVVSFQGSAVRRDQLRGILAEHLALEQARLFRQLLVRQFAVLALILPAVAFVWLSGAAVWFSLAFCIAVPVWAWKVERGCERRLAQRLDQVPCEKVIKSS
jgi:hypothetical protein